MAIPEAQLLTWESQGSITQSKDTYATIKGALEDRNAPYCAHRLETFLQGSYGNDTNVYADSDVDIVMQLTDIYYKDLSRLSDADRAAYNAAMGGGVSYAFPQFKNDVIAWLTKKYGANVKPGKKAVCVEGNGNRRDADVVVCADFRRYNSFVSAGNQRYDEGICFFTPDGSMIENFPKQHSANCTEKHKATGQRLKPTVRMFKNMRNRMIERGELAGGVAPSYYLEGMLYNVPSDKFVSSRQDTFTNCFNWIVQADREKLVCANYMHWLVRDGQPWCWPIQSFNSYLAAAKKHWEKG